MNFLPDAKYLGTLKQNQLCYMDFDKILLKILRLDSVPLIHFPQVELGGGAVNKMEAFLSLQLVQK